MREPPGGPSVGVWGHWEGSCLLSCPHLHPGRRASQGRRVPQSRHYGSLTICTWHFFSFISFTHLPLPTPQLTQPAAPSSQEGKSIFIFGVRRLFSQREENLGEDLKTHLSLTGLVFFPLNHFYPLPIILFRVYFHGFFFFFSLCVYKIKTKGRNRFLKFRTNFCI